MKLREPIRLGYRVTAMPTGKTNLLLLPKWKDSPGPRTKGAAGSQRQWAKDKTLILLHQLRKQATKYVKWHLPHTQSLNSSLCSRTKTWRTTPKHGKQPPILENLGLQVRNSRSVKKTCSTKIKNKTGVRIVSDC